MNKEDQIKDLNNQLEELDDKVKLVNKAEGYIDDVRVVKAYLDELNEVNDINIINQRDELTTKTTIIYNRYQEDVEELRYEYKKRINYLEDEIIEVKNYDGGSIY